MTTAQSPAATAPLGGTLFAKARARPKPPLIGAAVLIAVVVALVSSAGAWPTSLVADPSHLLARFNDWIVHNRDTSPVFTYFFGHISNALVLAVRGVYLVLLHLGWVGMLLAAVALGWWAGGRRVAAISGLALVLCGVLGLWVPTIQTLALMVVAVVLSVVIGAVLGVLAGGSPRFDRMLQPVLDTMQVLPAFAYLLPVVMIFGIGVPAAAIATVIYAVPPMARLTALGLRGADAQVIEAVRSLGSTRPQRLLTARLPLARRELMLGVNQSIMMALSMVVLASVIGSGGLGDRVYQGLATVDVGKSLSAGIAIVLIAIMLDRFTDAVGARLAGDRNPLPGQPSARFGVESPTMIWGIRVVAVLAVIAGSFGPEIWPMDWSVTIDASVNEAVDWMTNNLYEGLPMVGGTAVWAGHFTEWVLDPIKSALQAVPWWLLLVFAGGLAWLRGSWRSALSAVLALAVIGVLGVWDPALNTLSQVLVTVLATLVFGIAIGVAASRSTTLEKILRPVLDTLQTLPQFVYLIPVVALFGVGRAPAVAAAVIYALPAVIRITTQGIRAVDATVLEASESLGATRRQQLWKVQLPLARPALLVAINQGVVLVLAMVIVGGLVGGGALGYQVVKGLQRGDLTAGLTSGVAIVCLGVLLDRITQPAAGRKEKH